MKTENNYALKYELIEIVVGAHPFLRLYAALVCTLVWPLATIENSKFLAFSFVQVFGDVVLGLLGCVATFQLTFACICILSLRI